MAQRDDVLILWIHQPPGVSPMVVVAVCVLHKNLLRGSPCVRLRHIDPSLTFRVLKIPYFSTLLTLAHKSAHQVPTVGKRY